MARRVDISTKLAAAGLALALLVFLVGDNIAGRLGLPWPPAPEEGQRAQEAKQRFEGAKQPEAIQGTAASSLTILINVGSDPNRQTELLRADLLDLNKALIIAAKALPKPVLIRYIRPSVTNSGRAACVASYDDSSLLPRTQVVSGQAVLVRHLRDCSISVAGHTPNQDLPLSDAIEMAARAAPVRVRRTLVVISAFKAPFAVDKPASLPALEGLRVILIDVAGAGSHRNGTAASGTGAWREALRRRGADVITFDASALDVPADLAADIVG